MSNQPQLRGTIELRGDKSLSHRAIIFAALAKGKSVLRNLSGGIDVAMTKSLYQSLGVRCAGNPDELIVESSGFHRLATNEKALYCGNSATTLRLSFGVLAGSDVSCVLTGDQSLQSRPIQRVITPLREMGADIHTRGGSDSPPVTVSGRPLRGISYRSPVASAQVKSAVLLAALHADGTTSYSEPDQSRDHTERFLAWQGVDITSSQEVTTLRPGVEIKAFEYHVAGDISTAAFLIVPALLTRGSEIRIRNLLINPTRTGILAILKEMGGDITIENQSERYGEPVADVIVRESPLVGIDTGKYPPVIFIDEVPILAAAAMFASGKTRICNVGELRVKESDRLSGIMQIINCSGGKAEVNGDDLIVTGGIGDRRALPQHQGDHRLAATIEIINLIRDGNVSGKYHDLISISAPEFYDAIAGLTA
ncbi:MAG: 3-phosphoshikimate 1-carboxyvinyltransferase [candidate division Zixibacteria bacterium]|nr:3-phosphoshikimate 1-carboxyvinyltransferase [candidate division Zixibacteria bacterium]